MAMSLVSRSVALAAVGLIVLLAAGPAGAAAPADAAEPPSLLERYNRAIFAMNGFIYRHIDSIGPKSAPAIIELSAGPPADGNLGNVVSNLVNEPLSAIASAVIGDLAGMRRAVERFSINSTAGLFGYYDRASAFGLPAEQRDLGLAFCARGVPAGPFVMLGFVGPRTLRDAFVDVVIVNLTMYSVAAAVFGAGTGPRHRGRGRELRSRPRRCRRAADRHQGKGARIPRFRGDAGPLSRAAGRALRRPRRGHAALAGPPTRPAGRAASPVGRRSVLDLAKLAYLAYLSRIDSCRFGLLSPAHDRAPDPASAPHRSLIRHAASRGGPYLSEANIWLSER